VTARIARDVIATLGSDLPKLRALDEEHASAPRAPGKWSPKQVNRHLAHVIAHIEPRALGTPCTVGEGAPVTLRFMAEDYARHLHHHLAQVLNPEAAAGKTHLPYA